MPHPSRREGGQLRCMHRGLSLPAMTQHSLLRPAEPYYSRHPQHYLLLSSRGAKRRGICFFSARHSQLPADPLHHFRDLSKFLLPLATIDPKSSPPASPPVVAVRSHITFSPFAVGVIRTRRASSLEVSLRTSFDFSSPATMRLIVGGLTCSASASSASDFAPPNTSTDSADNCAGPIPLSRSRTRNRRSR